MKHLLILSLMLLVSCGRSNFTGGSSGSIYSNQYASRSMQVGNPNEIHAHLVSAVRMGRLQEYHQTRWHLYNGTYLMTSIVTSANSYRLVR